MNNKETNRDRSQQSVDVWGDISPSEHITKHRQTTRKQETRKQIDKSYHHLDESCDKTKENLSKIEQRKEWINECLETNPELVSATISQKLIYACLCLIIPCAYLINVLLIYRPVEYLVVQNLGKDSWLTSLAIMTLPLVILLFEIGLSSLIFLVKEKDQEISQKLAQIMVWITPCLLLATNIAKFTAKRQLPGLHDILLIAVLMALAFITDAIIVYGISPMNMAFSYLIFTINLKIANQQNKQDKIQARKAATEAEKHLTDYFNKIDDFERTYEENFDKPIRFNYLIVEIINWKKGYDFLQYPDDDLDTPDAGVTRGKRPPNAPNDSSSTTPHDTGKVTQLHP